MGVHTALIASKLKGIESLFYFYGAEVTTPRSDSNFALIVLFEKLSEKLNFICYSSDDLIPLKDRLEIKKRFKKVDILEDRFIYVEVKELIMALCAKKENHSLKMNNQLIGII